MGKVILEFDSFEERDDIKNALEGYKWKMVVWDLDQKLRSTTKYDVSCLKENEEASELEIEIAEKYREIIREILEDYKLFIED
jgi:hypothetical protein